MDATTSNSYRLREAYTINEFAEAFGVGRTSAFKLIKSGEIKTVRILGRNFILREEIDRFKRSLMEAMQ